MIVSSLSRTDIVIATIFTQVEVLTLTVWAALILLAVNINPLPLIMSPLGKLAIVEVEIGLEAEHLISRLKG